MRFHHQANERIKSNNKILIIIYSNYRIQIKNINRANAQKKKEEDRITCKKHVTEFIHNRQYNVECIYKV